MSNIDLGDDPSAYLYCTGKHLAAIWHPSLRNSSEEVLERASGVLVSDFYSAYHHYDGPIQRCWAHLLRDIHDLQTIYPDDASVTQRAGAVQDTYRHATALDHHHQPMRRLTTNWAWNGDY